MKTTLKHMMIFLLCLGTPIMGLENKIHIVTGAGATFPYPLYEKMFATFQEKENIKINYQPIGSGAGITQLRHKIIDFSGSDTFMPNKITNQFDNEIIHIPICLGAVAIAYNLPQLNGINLDADVLALIFLGKIKTWNDPKIKALNPKIALPNIPITVVHRSDSSGTSFIFSEFLSKSNKEWNKTIGKSQLIRWKTGIGALRNAGVAQNVAQIKGAIGYMELVYALNSELEVAKIKNRSGRFIMPSLKSTSEAANTPFPRDTFVTFTHTLAPGGYPLSSATWIIIYKDQAYNGKKREEAKNLITLLRFMINEGQSLAEPMGYAKLPAQAQTRANALLETVLYNGKKIY